MRAFVTALLLTAGLWAQTATPGRLEGRVTTPGGDAIPRAKVTAVLRVPAGMQLTAENVQAAAQNPVVYNVDANSDGIFSIPNAQPGQYTLTAQLDGYVGGRQLRADLQPGTTASGISLQLEKSSPAKVEGRVSTPADEPLARATVTLTSLIALPPGAATTTEAIQAATANRRTYTATTDTEGKFSIANLEPGRYTVAATRTGYMPASASPTGQPTQSVDIGPGRTTSGISVKLIKQAAIYGRVVDEFGDPMPGAQVKLYRRVYTRGRWQMQLYRPGTVSAATVNGVTSGVDGSFSIGEMEPGRYFVSADRSRTVALTTNSPPGAEVYVMTYYPNATTMGLAVGVPVAASTDVRGIEIRMQKAKGFTVKGKVTGPDRIPTGYVTITPNGNTAATDAYILSSLREDGSFQFTGVPNGPYVLQLTDYGPEGRPNAARILNPDPNAAPLLVARLPLQVADQNMELMVQATPGAVIEGTMQGLPASSTGLSLAGNTAAAAVQGYVYLQPATVGSQVRGEVRGGKFRIADVAPGTYQANISIPAAGYVKRAHYDNQDVTNKLITIGTSGAKLEVELANDGGSAQASVRDDKGAPVPRVPVSLWAAGTVAEDSTLFFRNLTSSATGTAGASGLPPGEYYMVAWESTDAQNGVAEAPEFLKQFESMATKVRIEPSGRVQGLEVKVVPRAEIELAVSKLL